MRKIILLTAIFSLALGGVANAQLNQNLGRVSDLTANEFVYRMSGSEFYSEAVEMGMNIRFTQPARRTELDDPQNFPNMKAATVNFGAKDSETFDGEICFFLDNDGRVSVIRLTNISNPDVSGVVLFMTFEALGLNRLEIAELVKDDASPDDSVWCAAAKRKICRRFVDSAGNIIFLFSTRD